MGDNNISIDEAKAKLWIADVEAEVRAVRLLLDQVAEENSNFAGDDDSVIQAICTIGEKMKSSWTELCSRFDQADDIVEKVIDDTVIGGQKIIDMFQGFFSRFHA